MAPEEIERQITYPVEREFPARRFDRGSLDFTVRYFSGQSYFRRRCRHLSGSTTGCERLIAIELPDNVERPRLGRYRPASGKSSTTLCSARRMTRPTRARSRLDNQTAASVSDRRRRNQRLGGFEKQYHILIDPNRSPSTDSASLRRGAPSEADRQCGRRQMVRVASRRWCS